MEKNLFNFLLILIGLTLSASLSAQDSSSASAPKEVHKQPINLNGMANLAYVPSKESYEDWRKVPKTWAAHFLLLAKQDGVPTYCEPATPQISSELGQRLCADLIANAKIEIAGRYSLGGREGIVALTKEPTVQLPGFGPNQGEFTSPFSFSLTDLEESTFLDYEPPLPFEIEQAQNSPLKFKAGSTKPEYPSQAAAKKMQGATSILLTANSAGDILSCRPIKSAGSTWLDSEACKTIFDHFQFETVASEYVNQGPFFFIQNIHWKIKGLKEGDK